MKKLTLLILLAALCVTLCGCLGQDTGSDTALSGDSASTESSSPEVTSSEGGTSSETQPSESGTAAYDSKDGLPAARQEIKTLYKEAAELYNSIRNDLIATDPGSSQEKWDADRELSIEYRRVTDSRFSNVRELRTFCRKYYTQSLTDTVLESSKSYPKFADIDGKLYMAVAGRGGRMDYAGHVFGTAAESGDTMKIPVKVYYDNVDMPSDTFYTEPADLSKYTVEEHIFELKKEKEGWRFDSFYPFY